MNSYAKERDIHSVTRAGGVLHIALRAQGGTWEPGQTEKCVWREREVDELATVHL